MRLGRARLEAHEGVRKIIADVVVLRRKIITLRLAFLPDQFGLLGVLVHVMRDWPHVVKKLRVHRPLAVLLPDSTADDVCAALGHSVAQREAISPVHHVAQSLVRHAPFVGRLGGGAEPALVDAAAIQPIGVRVVRMQLEPQPRLQERARHPSGREPEQPAGFLEGSVYVFADILFDSLELFNRCE